MIFSGSAFLHLACPVRSYERPQLICLALGAASLLSAYRRSGADGASPAIAQLTFRRYVRSGLVAAVIFNVANIYLMAMALTGQSAPWLG